MDDRLVIGELVRRLGGTEQVATALGTSQESVYMWSKLGRVPWKWRFTVRQLAMARKVLLSPDERVVLALKPESKEAIAG